VHWRRWAFAGGVVPLKFGREPGGRSTTFDDYGEGHGDYHGFGDVDCHRHAGDRGDGHGDKY
jgi:hypothetical protein